MTAIATGDSTSPVTATPGISSQSEAYELLAFAFSFPGSSFHESVRQGQWTERLNVALGGLPCRLRTSDLNWLAFETHDEMQTEYIRLFQIGGRHGPPCPLHQGHYERDRSQTLRNLIRFYNYFGFSVAECIMPDHIAVQLEFMSALAKGDVTDSESGLRAQRDFLRRHLAWTGDLADRASRAAPHPFYRSLTALTCRLIAADRQLIGSTLGEHDDER